jgi:branched-chain amino acid transport system substrate-binding protein
MSRSRAACAASVFIGVLGLAAAVAPVSAADSIKVGAVSTLTGPFTFPESSAGAKAVFDRVNANGGINGRMIEYVVGDDKFDPGAAAQAAHRLVDSEGVVANVGSASVLECSVNAKYYASKDFLSITGTGIDWACFTSPSISPVNTGPYSGIAVTLYYAAKVLNKTKMCAFVPGSPGTGPGYEYAFGAFKKLTGIDLLAEDRTLQPNDDLTQVVLRAKRAGCEATLFAGIEPQVVALLRAAKAQNVTGMTWLFLTSAYTESLPKALGPDAEGIYANSEFEPFTSDSATLKDWKDLMAAAKVPASSFSEGGYIAATIFVDVLKSIKGEINRESVTKALRALDKYETPMLGQPYAFGPGDAHNPNKSSKFVQVKDGAWQSVTPDFFVLPSE